MTHKPGECQGPGRKTEPGGRSTGRYARVNGLCVKTTHVRTARGAERGRGSGRRGESLKPETCGGLKEVESDDRLGDKGVKHRRVRSESISAKGLQVKLDRGFHIPQGLLKSIALSDDHPVYAYWVGHIAIGVLLHNDLQGLVHAGESSAFDRSDRGEGAQGRWSPSTLLGAGREEAAPLSLFPRRSRR